MNIAYLCVFCCNFRPGRTGANASGRGVLSMQGLGHGVVRVDSENSLTSLTLQDCGQVMPGGVMVVVKPDGPPTLCKTDEVGELCLSSPYAGSGYWGLAGITNSSFKVSILLLCTVYYYYSTRILGGGKIMNDFGT